ncbi:MAG: hypothetical protein LBK27_03610 [Treponema sp.]|jgi:hypothetical protein|nr:hypothetical protein [Treponema sp.]
MNDLESAEPYGSTKALAKQGVAAVAMIGGGVFLFVIEALARFRVIGLIMGAVAGIVGVSALLSKDPDDKKPGLIITAAGLLVILSKTGIPVLRSLAPTLLNIGAVGLLVMGIWKGVKFLRGLKSRS